MLTKIVSSLLVLTLTSSMATPIASSFKVRQAVTNVSTEVEAELPEPDSEELPPDAKFYTEEELEEAENARPNKKRDMRSVPSWIADHIVGVITAYFGATYAAGYALGQWAFNNGYSRRGFYSMIVSSAGNLLNPAFSTGFDNGYMAAYNDYK